MGLANLQLEDVFKRRFARILGPRLAGVSTGGAKTPAATWEWMRMVWQHTGRVAEGGVGWTIPSTFLVTSSDGAGYVYQASAIHNVTETTHTCSPRYGSTECGAIASNGTLQAGVTIKLEDCPDMGYTKAVSVIVCPVYSI